MARHTRTRALEVPSGPVTLSLPHLWSPRGYQRPLVMAMPANAGATPKKTRRRIVQVWHRRAGKDLSGIALTTREMQHRLGYYIHVFPTLKQGKAIVWDGKDNAGIPFIDRFPKELVLEKNETETQIVLKPLPGQIGYGNPNAKGSIWQLRGADDPDSLRGGNPVGVVFSEFQQMDENVWNIVRPILEANGGWAMFLFTPEGQNHAYKLYKMALDNPEEWFCQLLTIDDTREDGPGESGGPLVTQAQIDQMRKEGVAEDSIQQEYYCSFVGYLRGTIFGDLVTDARKDGRISRIPWNANQPVGVLMDIGRYDSTAGWFWQRKGDSICFIDYFEDRLKGADYYIKLIKERPYIVSKVILPWDAKVKGFTASLSTEEVFRRAFGNVAVAEKIGVQAGIDMTRRFFSRLCFDEVKCARGIECLEKYRRKYDEGMKSYVGDPIHDEYSHGADAVRTGVIGGLEYPLEFRFGASTSNPAMAESEFDVFSGVVN